MRLLVVEDEAAMAESLRRGLEAEGFAVDVADNGVDGLHLATEVAYDAIILDLMLPQMNGYQVCQALRDDGIWSPILMLTAKHGDLDEAEGFETGADDYLTKPFEPKELLLRINSILRRVPATEPAVVTPKVLSLGALRYDVEKGTMWDGDTPVRLTATEAQLMRIFSGCPGEALSRSKLVEDLGRDGGQAQERAVDVQITRLRRKLEADPKQPRYLQTVRGAGYMLAPD